MLRSLRLRNFRGFPDDVDLPFVDLKPLTILIGKNSSGKSSFLRVFPLLRQSVESKTSGPILWYGRYVDFGDFSTVKNKNQNSDIVTLDFKVNSVFGGESAFKDSGFGMVRAHERGDFASFPAMLSMGLSVQDKKTIIKKLDINIMGNNYQFNFDDAICDFHIGGELFGKFTYFNSYPFPSELFHWKKGDSLTNRYSGFSELSKKFIENVIDKKNSRKFINYFNNSVNLKDKSPEDLLDEINYMSAHDVEEFLRPKLLLSSLAVAEERKFLKKCNELAAFSFDKNISDILESLKNEIINVFRSVKYTAPLRASGERYYRFQDLQVEEMDHTGQNLAMMLRSFDSDQLSRFSAWTMEFFGFGIGVLEVDLHCEILIEIDSIKYNMSDMGFGFSQLMPILASIWFEIINRPKRRSKFPLIFAIEQPELHLHPEYQSIVAKIFASVISLMNKRSFSGKRINLVIETHSKAMIDSIGDSIKSGIISNKDVSIVLFGRENVTGFSTIKKSSYDESGYLIDWPIGFFSGR